MTKPQLTRDSPSTSAGVQMPDYLADLPWERFTLWGVLGLLLYVMRDYFLVIFMTFLIGYFVRRIVSLVVARLPVNRQTVWTDRVITVGVFLLLFALLGGVFATLVPKAIEQAKTVFFKIEHSQVQVEADRLLRSTVGNMFFRRAVGNASDPRYQQAFAQFRSSPDVGSGIFAALPSWASTVRAQFDAAQPDDITRNRATDLQFVEYWQQQHQEHPDAVPIDYEAFQSLDSVRSQGQLPFASAFAKVLERLSVEQRQNLAQLDFEFAVQSRLAMEWWDRDPIATSIRHYLSDELPNWLRQSGASAQSLISACLSIPVHLGMAIVLSYLITVDVHRITARLNGLSETRTSSTGLRGWAASCPFFRSSWASRSKRNS